MGPELKKRARPAPSDGALAQKRQKIEPKQKKTKVIQKRPAPVDALPWKELKMPEMFDDAEGFYGLEEVEGVEIVRDGQNVKFVTSTVVQTDNEEEEFEGFGDEGKEDDATEKPKPIIKASGEPEKESKQKKATRKRNEAKKAKRDKARQEKAATENETEDTSKEGIFPGATPIAKPAEAEEEKKKGKPDAMKDKKDKKPKKGKTDHDSEEEEESNPLPSNIFEVLQSDDAEVDVSAWDELDLSSPTLSALSKLGFSTPTPIQSAAIPEILAGHDVVGKASTGSGKTLAFGIPIIESWLERYGELDEEELKVPRPPTALILSPTRELAHQLTEHLTSVCKGMSTSPWVAAVTGGLSVQKQQRQVAKADIVIGTPGRLWEVISGSIELTASFRQIKFLVIDEADRLLTDGHFKEADEILTALDRKAEASEEGEEGENIPTRQTLVFSATFHKGLQQKLAGKGKQALVDDSQSMEYLLKKLNFREDKPKFVDVNPISQMAEGLKEGMVECSGLEKDLYLYSLLLYNPGQRTLIFTNSIHAVRRLTPMLQNLNLPAHALHSQMAQKARMRSIERFSATKATSAILIATDIAARGLDIPGVQLVIHYHLPRTADMYVHRSGRTARAEALGTSILMCAPEEIVGTRRLVAKVHAQNAVAGGGSKSKYYMRSLDIDRKVVARLSPRVKLAKQIADSGLAKEKKGHDDEWIKNAAEELGIEYDSEEFEALGGGSKGRGTGRKLKEKAARNLTKSEVGALRGELKSLLAQRVNVGVSERYLTAGRVDVNELLKGVKGEFLGRVDGIGMDDL